MISPDETRFWACNTPVNEFGFFYMALFIFGSYARYYPDKWVKDVDAATPLALAVEELLVQADNRVPMLSFCEMSRTSLVPE